MCVSVWGLGGEGDLAPLTVCEDTEQLKTVFLLPVLVITATVGVCLQQPRL